MNEKKTLKQRRIESDIRIIHSSIRCFGKKGYTGCSLKEIASEAGVTAGLITQRYETKENLFTLSYIHIKETYFSDVEEGATPRECLISILNQIKDLRQKDIDAFNFCCMYYRSNDYPKDKILEFVIGQHQRNIYKILFSAQEKGILPKGNLDTLLYAFCANTFLHILLCITYNLDLPDDGYYLKAINFKDAIFEDQETWKRIIKSVAYNAFEMVSYINLLDNKGKTIQYHQNFSFSGDTDDVRNAIQMIIKKAIKKEEKQNMSAHLDLDTLGDRMKGHKELCCSFTDDDGNIYRHLYFPVSWDDKGNLLEVFSAIYKIS